MRGRQFILSAIVVVCLGLGAWPGAKSAGTGNLFAAYGSDYVSPLITSSRVIQTLNKALGREALFAGYDQHQVVATAPYFHIARITRYSGDILAVLGSEFLLDARGRCGAAPIYLTESYWQRMFAGSSSVLGTTLEFGGERYTVAGVVRTTDGLIEETDIWAPIPGRGPYGSISFLRLVASYRQDGSWTRQERSLAELLHTVDADNPLELSDGVRLLPLERKLVVYPETSPRDDAYAGFRKSVRKPAA